VIPTSCSMPEIHISTEICITSVIDMLEELVVHRCG
jgi:hypothetical protein